jgi:hypothetical protein
LGVRAVDLEASEDRGEEGSARGKRIEPLLRVILGSGEDASRRRGEHWVAGWWARGGRTVHGAAGRALLRSSGQRSSGRKKGKEGEG